ncbi:hypothetical protein [Enterococcus wangshanyuanii]|uniref:Minor capsid protein n=1 Tax=Enterococcus wangshanyuanii TaxID=2005703 RepID=A0ABQ1PJG2_9ENTE|nr:hypothetical protein [Enterococcus wangshanyuanii]GGC98043.1 hypothetical protein GCM10011573_29480 [Enterococcus wangshanyuanii]
MEKMMFASLVAAFAVDFTLILPTGNKGKYIKGEWVPDNQEPVATKGAIIPYDDRTIYQSGGTLTTSDRQLAYVGDIPLGSHIIDAGKEYKVESEEPFREHYADTNLYRLKAVSKNG